MITSGIDLATVPAKTGLATIAWDDRARCTTLTVGVDDATAVAAAAASDRCGIDAPFGWPDDFVGFVTAHHDGAPTDVPADTERLRLRATDVWVWREIGKRPLSVSTDLIGVTAFRCARLQTSIAAVTGEPVDRTGGGRLLEAYPAGALAVWRLPSSGYKRAGPDAAERRRRILDTVTGRFALALTEPQRALAATNDDALDALVTAVIARLAALGRTALPPPDLAARAAREGWIHVPVD